MKANIFVVLFALVSYSVSAQMSPEALWQLGRVGAHGISTDGESLVYGVTTPNVESNDFNKELFKLDFQSGNIEAITSSEELLSDSKFSPDGKWKLESRDVKLKKVTGSDLYPDLKSSNAYVYDQLHYRHWDHWEDGAYGHVFLVNVETGDAIDLLEGEPFDCPTKPFGGMKILCGITMEQK